MNDEVEALEAEVRAARERAHWRIEQEQRQFRGQVAVVCALAALIAVLGLIQP